MAFPNGTYARSRIMQLEPRVSPPSSSEASIRYRPSKSERLLFMSCTKQLLAVLPPGQRTTRSSQLLYNYSRRNNVP